MAIFVPGPAIGRISGDVGGINFVSSKAASIVRIAMRAGKETSTAQQDRLARVQRSVAAWNELPESIRVEWRRFAENRRAVNRLGVQTATKGFNQFIAHALDVHNGQPPPDMRPPVAVIHIAPKRLEIGTFEPDIVHVTQFGDPIGEDNPELIARVWLHRYARTTQVSGFNNPRVLAEFSNPNPLIDLTPALAARNIALQQAERIGIGIDWRWADNTYAQITWAGHTVDFTGEPPDPFTEELNLGDPQTEPGAAHPQSGDPEVYEPAIFQLADINGNVWWIFVATTGILRISNVEPETDTFGEAVGAQF